MMNLRTFGILCLIAAALLAGVVLYHNSQKGQIPIVFSSRDMISAIWAQYQKSYVESPSGRTVDLQDSNVTTSEGEGYTMLRSVWSDNQQTFDQSWLWTQQNLSQPNSHLFSWLYGQRPDATWGVRTDIGGQNSASDADTDIALALLFGYGRWQDPKYLNAAKPIIIDIWNREVVTVNGKPYLAANNLEKNLNTSTIVINPSYFAPYAYRIFAKVDPAHPWLALVDTSYDVLRASMADPLDKNKSAGLPPDWVLMNRVTGDLEPPTGDLKTDYSFDAMRVPWRLALDWQWYQEPRARQTLADMSFLKTEWAAQHALDAGYGHDGAVIDSFEAPAMYGASMGYFLVADTGDANSVFNAKLRSLYDPDHDSWKQRLSYYDDNWAWFGIALYYNFLPNLAANIHI